MHKFKWLNGKGMFSTYWYLYLWASRPRIHPSVCICVHQAQEILSPRYLAKTLLIVTKCQSCIKKLSKVCAKLSSVVIAWLVTCHECYRIDFFFKTQLAWFVVCQIWKTLDLGPCDRIKLHVTIVLIDWLMASYK